MKTANFTQNLIYKDERPNVEMLLDTEFTKEIRITFKSGQIMKEHKAPLPIVVMVFDGKIDFGVEGQILHLQKGDMITLASNVPHDLKALEDSIVRLTLSKGDQISRVEDVTKK